MTRPPVVRTRTAWSDARLRERGACCWRHSDRRKIFADGSSAVRTPGRGILTLDAAETAPGTKDEYAGTRIGNYKLLEKIGEGGCGVVYMAEQERLAAAAVALKVTAGRDTKAVIARFEAERRALAMMDHLNIARARCGRDGNRAGPTSQMEPAGLPRSRSIVTRIIPETDRRLHLFIQVRQAIQHAHQKRASSTATFWPSNIPAHTAAMASGVKVIDLASPKPPQRN